MNNTETAKMIERIRYLVKNYVRFSPWRKLIFDKENVIAEASANSMTEILTYPEREVHIVSICKRRTYHAIRRDIALTHQVKGRYNNSIYDMLDVALPNPPLPYVDEVEAFDSPLNPEDITSKKEILAAVHSYFVDNNSLTTQTIKSYIQDDITRNQAARILCITKKDFDLLLQDTLDDINLYISCGTNM